jgi:c-di-GMP-binding flagellar brake protein YcgR
MFLERRGSVRIPCELPSSYRNLVDPTDKSSRFSLVKDISHGGVKLNVQHFIPLADKLILSLNIPRHRTLDVRVAPAWITEEPSTGTFNLGARFLEISEEARIAIQNFKIQALAV